MAVTRERIADSFEACLGRRGYRSTSVEDIARDLRISKKTIYVHFESKDELYAYVVGRRAAADCERIADALKDFATDAARVEGLVRSVLAETRERADSPRDAESASLSLARERIYFDAYTDLLRRYIRSGWASGEFTTGGDEITVRLVSGLLIAGARMYSEDAEAAVEGPVTEAVIRVLTC
ncbi:MAG TPA: TetR/AcrR family transcriptional regulator [Coriobacteriia bacterium]|nr:TetR/AcrR family transcriptional regulator [Coriobacteriia bacterium]